MKRKTKTGLKLISSLVERMPKEKDANQSLQNDESTNSHDFIQNLIFIYRAYAYFVIEDYESCIKDYLKSNQLKKLSNGSQYNLYLAQGLKGLHLKEYENAISFFSKASQRSPT
jgi:tetratricopeptide (TPR) repeat protein